MPKSDTFIKITNKDIFVKLEGLKEVTDKIHNHAQKTNWRVTLLEKKSVGVWISNNPVRFALILIIFLSIVISDIRHPFINYLQTLI